MAQVDAGVYVWENYDNFYSSRPNFDLDVRLQYTGRKFSAGVNVEYQGGIKWMTRTEEQTADGVVYKYISTLTRNTINLGVDVEWRINDSWAVFAQGRNLTGSKLYEWLNYYTDSAQCIVGAKFSF
jgi:lipopolysaccharide assembly outer membrane protein LptD (OstA)